MRNNIFCLVLMILSISTVYGLYAGENFTFPLDIEDPVYTVVGNSSEITGMNVSYNETHINIITKINMKPDDFTLIFMNRDTEEVVKVINKGGGGSTKYVEVENKSPEYITLSRIKYYNNTDFCVNDSDINKTINDSQDSQHIIEEETYKFYSLVMAGVSFFLLVIIIILGTKLIMNERRFD